MAAWLVLSLCLLLPLALIFTFLLQKNHKTRTQIRKPPGPPGLPLIGNLHQFSSSKPHELLMKLSKKYGPLMSLKLGTVPVVVISSAKTAREALKSHDLRFSGRPPLISHRKYSYNGLDIAFAPYGEYWRQMRKMSVLQLLSHKKVESFLPILEDEVSLFIKEISDLSSSSSSQVINLSSMAMNLASSIICRIGFGKKYDKGDQEKKRFDEMLHECEAMLGGFFVSDYLPLLGWIDKLSGMSARLEKNFKDMDLFYQELIEDHLNPNRPDTMRGDILDILIQMKDDQLSSSLDFTWDHIKAMLMDVFVAGTDTNSALIVWAMTALMKDPATMKRVQAEVRDTVGKKGVVREEVVEELVVLNAVIKETLRLYPPSPLLVPREMTGKCRMEGGYDIESKTMVFINAWAIARDPEYWENTDEFFPDRFLMNSGIDVKGNDFGLIPFGAGRRICPGISLGLSTVKLTLANLLYSFDWERELPLGTTVQDIDADVLPGIVMHKKNPLCLVAKKYTFM